MQIIDIHTHIYPVKIADAAVNSIRDFYHLDGRRMDGTTAMLNLRMQQAGISRCVVLPVANKASHVQSINNFIHQEVQDNPNFVGFGTVHAAMADLADEVARIQEMGLKGIKIHPDFQQFDIDDPRLFPMYESIQGKLPVIFHMGDPQYDFSHPTRLRHILQLFPELETIGAHLGGYSMYETACEILKDTNCVMDLSSASIFLGPRETERYVNLYGAERLGFGSDYPLWDPVEEVQRFLALDLTLEQKEQIAHKTAERILKL